ncbi:MAG: NAD(P)H-hydrate epimerase [Planctomycetota bacterium]
MAANHGMRSTPYREGGPGPDEPVFSREGVRALDAAAVAELGLPGVVLMENAALALEQACVEIANGEAAGAVIAVGPGNNGGDGLALARRLLGLGWTVLVALSAPSPRFSGDAGINYAAAAALGVPMIDPEDAVAAAESFAAGATHQVIAVDCLFGTGLTRPITGVAAELVAMIDRLRGRGAVVLGADLPSGLDAETGEPIGDVVVRADRTVTFAGWKIGLTKPTAGEFSGVVTVGGIGVPVSFARRFALGA